MTMVDTPSTADPALNKIGALLSQNTSNTSFIKVCENDGADDPVHDEGYDAIASHQTSIFLVQSRLGQEEGRTTMVDNVSMAPLHRLLLALSIIRIIRMHPLKRILIRNNVER